MHANQYLQWIALGESIGLPTKYWAEKKAYEYELTQAARFGLSNAEKNLIENLLREYSK